MVASLARALLVAAAIASARAHLHSHDNILRVQLWDAEGLSRDAAAAPEAVAPKPRPRRVDARVLHQAMLDEGYGVATPGRFTRHRVRHKRRRARRSREAPAPAWRFHDGLGSINVVSYEEGEPEPDARPRDAAPPLRLQATDGERDEDAKLKKKLPVVPKCCSSGQNLSSTLGGQRDCQLSALTFQPMFYDSNSTHVWSYDSNLFETIVGNPCVYDRYTLEPEVNSEDEFYLLVNGSLFVPYQNPTLLSTKNYCMETFWSDLDPAGLTRPVLCFLTPEITTSSSTLIVYAAGLIISVPFLLATMCVYTFITELRTTYGKSLACHCACLATAFSCLAATQLAGHAFPRSACTIMAYLIQFSFVSCFFWLNVMCFDTLWNVKMERKLIFSADRAEQRRRFMWYCAYAFILPLILLLITMVMDLTPAVPSTYLKPNFGVKGCWFKTDEAALPYFYGPVAVTLLTNFCFFFCTSRGITRLRNDPDMSAVPMMVSNTPSNAAFAQHNTTTSNNISDRLKRYRKKFRMSLYLCVLMCVSWVLEVGSWAAGAGAGPSVWSVFDVINALQGLVIFVIYVLQKPVRTKIKDKWFKRPRMENAGLLSVVSEPSIEENGRRDDV